MDNEYNNRYISKEKSLALDRNRWDLVMDTKGNIATVSNPYSIAQDVACSLRCFRGECWYDTSQGVPYITDVFTNPPSLSLIKARLEEQAIRVPHVKAVNAVFTVSDTLKRVLYGAVIITDDYGNEMGIEI